jgi:lysophospholipase L1-like esterase
MKFHTICLTFAMVMALAIAGGEAAPPPAGSSGSTGALKLKDGDNHIVFIGSGLIEQAQFAGYIETRLARRFPNRHITFRNLGWSGDNVWGAARISGYNNPAGFGRLMKELSGLKPDIIFIAYGSDESFAGEGDLAHFEQGYDKLLDACAALTPNLVLLSPAFAEDWGRPMPDPTAHNHDLERYSAAINQIAQRRHLPFVDLFHATLDAKKAHSAIRLTTNGILPNDAEYWIIAQAIARQLGVAAAPWKVDLTADGKVTSATGAKAADVHASPSGLKLNLTPDVLTAPPPPASLAGTDFVDAPPRLRVSGLAAGDWTLKVDGATVLTAPAAQWAAGVSIRGGVSTAQVEKLRDSIVQRNHLYYRRWRPFNDHPRHYTYIAGDYALYDQELAQQDKEIAALAIPAAHVIQIIPKSTNKP